MKIWIRFIESPFESALWLSWGWLSGCWATGEEGAVGGTVRESLESIDSEQLKKQPLEREIDQQKGWLPSLQLQIVKTLLNSWWRFAMKFIKWTLAMNIWNGHWNGHLNWTLVMNTWIGALQWIPSMDTCSSQSIFVGRGTWSKIGGQWKHSAVCLELFSVWKPAGKPTIWRECVQKLLKTKQIANFYFPNVFSWSGFVTVHTIETDNGTISL